MVAFIDPWFACISTKANEFVGMSSLRSRYFYCAPAVWKSVPKTVLIRQILSLAFQFFSTVVFAW